MRGIRKNAKGLNLLKPKINSIPFLFFNPVKELVDPMTKDTPVVKKAMIVNKFSMGSFRLGNNLTTKYPFRFSY